MRTTQALLSALLVATFHAHGAFLAAHVTMSADGSRAESVTFDLEQSSAGVETSLPISCASRQCVNKVLHLAPGTVVDITGNVTGNGTMAVLKAGEVR